MGNPQSKPGSPRRAQTLKTSFGCRVPLNVQDWFPVSETNFQPRRFTSAFVRFWISTYSAGLSTEIMRTEPPLVGVAGELVLVGIGDAVSVEISVSVAVGMTCVAVGLSVGEGVSVGNGEGPGNVGKGVNVAPRLNRAVGVGPVPCVRNISGLGVTPGELRG